MTTHLAHIRQKLEKRKAQNAFRELKINNGLIDFCSNDYLGFATEKEIHRSTDLSQFGSTGSRLISGNHAITEELENYLAHYYRAQSALIFNSGYNANLGLFSCIAQRTDTIIYDELVHASIRDGISLSHAHSFSFKHNDLISLKDKISQSKGNIFVVVESVYSMDGDEAPLEEIVKLCKENGAALIVDEAHAVGVYGHKGEGLVAKYGLENEVFARIITFGKAYGCHGAAVLGIKDLRDYLINFSRAFIYTTALPLSSIITIGKAHQFLNDNNERMDQLNDNIAYFKAAIANYQLSIINSDSAIQCIIISGNDQVKIIAEKISDQGFDVRPILSPTVPKGQERLRICLHSFNTREQIDDLLKVAGGQL